MRDMTDKEKYALALITDTEMDAEERDEMEREYFPHYGLYHREDDHQVVFCTHCEQWFNAHTSTTKNSSYGSKTFSTKKAKHGERDTCPLCEYGITYLADGRGRRTKRDCRNFAVFRAVSDTELVIRCYRMERTFFEPGSGSLWSEICDHVFDFIGAEVCRYYLSIGEAAMRFIPGTCIKEGRWHTVWRKAVECKEPTFVTSPYGFADNTYTVIGGDCIEETQFRYIQQAINDTCMNPRQHSYLYENLITVLGEYSVHPQIEYLIKTGFTNVVVDKICRCLGGLRLNWKSNNVRKVLGLTAEEMELLRERDTTDIAHYKELRRRDRRSPARDITEVLEGCRTMNQYYFVRDTMLTLKGETCRSVLRYLKKNNATLYEWFDYTGQCRRLGYDLDDPVIWKPSNLIAAHDRCSRAIEAIELEEAAKCNKEKDRNLRRLNKVRQVLRYTAEDLGLTVVLPTCVQDIVNEGKTLVHCVAGYADRHAMGTLTILFIRRENEPEKPYYTMEVSSDNRIVQCRGYKNDREAPKPQAINEFERRYQMYLDLLHVFREETKEKQKNKKKTA